MHKGFKLDKNELYVKIGFYNILKETRDQSFLLL